MTPFDRFRIRLLFWRGRTVAEIAEQVGWSMRDVEAVLFVRVKA